MVGAFAVTSTLTESPGGRTSVAMAARNWIFPETSTAVQFSPPEPVSVGLTIVAPVKPGATSTLADPRSPLPPLFAIVIVNVCVPGVLAATGLGVIEAEYSSLP